MRRDWYDDMTDPENYNLCVVGKVSPEHVVEVDDSQAR
jgi:predicted Zn-dependent peptidase